MRTIQLRNTQLRVSEMCLGTAQFGTGCSREKSAAQMNLYTEAGGNFLDTALVYGDWGSEPSCSEKTVGRWMKEKHNRSSLVLSTKGCHPYLETMHLSRVSAECLQEDVEASLKNLQTDYIDLYFLHRDNEKVPAGELLEALEEQVRKGNIRYYGCSNWTLARVREAADYAGQHALKGFVCNQAEFALADIHTTPDDMVILEKDFYRYHRETGLNAMAYKSLAAGYFTKRLVGREISEGMQKQYGGAGNEAILHQLRQYESEGYVANDFLLHYITDYVGKEFPAIALCGFRTCGQLEDALAGLERTIPQELLTKLAALKECQNYEER